MAQQIGEIPYFSPLRLQEIALHHRLIGYYERFAPLGDSRQTERIARETVEYILGGS
jgi:hypothetical protein